MILEEGPPSDLHLPARGAYAAVPPEHHRGGEDVMAAVAVPTRDEAIHILEEGRAPIEELLDRLSPWAMTTPGLGGGRGRRRTSSGTWRRGRSTRSTRSRHGSGTSAPRSTSCSSRSRPAASTTTRSSARRRGPSRGCAERPSARTRSLLDTIAGMSDARWSGPTTSRGPQAARGAGRGGMLSGARPFEHDASHLQSLSTFVARHALDRHPPV